MLKRDNRDIYFASFLLSSVIGHFNHREHREKILWEKHAFSSCGSGLPPAIIEMKGSGKARLGGFCYFNNIAIAVRKALKRCAIIDIDCHHGNGTQDIFLKDNKVMYFSIHRNGFFYPGTGTETIGNCINYPSHYPAQTDWLNAFCDIISRVCEFSPELIAVSAGFDTYKDDPIAGFGLSCEVYEEIDREISNLSKPTL